MQQTRKKLRQAARIMMMWLLVVAMVLPLSAPQAYAVTQADIDALKKDATSLKSQKKDLQSKLDALADDKSAAVQKKNLLDQQISNIQSQISNTEKQISDYNALIDQTQAELEDAEAKEEAQYELFRKRVRAMEERGTISYWSVLFKADSFTDLLSRLDFINEIMDSDQSVINQLQQLQVEIQNKQDSLKSQKADAESAKAQLVSQRSELDTQRKAANALVIEIEANAKEYASTLKSLAQEEESIQAEIVALSKKLAAQQAAAGNSTSNAALGGYIWPVSSRKVNSPFGSRSASATNGVGSTNHKGIDIGGVGYTTTVVAAKAGTVIVSQHSNSYGNYVVISHGSGNTTLYAHMSSRSVSVGQTVAQGQAVGVTGSTGHSTGPHLHFEITENGSRIDPLKYLTNYTKGW